MLNFLRRKFIKDYNNLDNIKVRNNHGKMAAILGIISNIFLFVIKISIGFIVNSISIISDSINNLSDSASSIVTLVGFHLAEKPADKEHPFGHERYEYIAGLIVAFVIIFVGGTLFYSSIMKIINYNGIEINYLLTYITIGILVLSILIKVWQSITYNKIAKLIKSVALEATSKDSLFDCISTSSVLIGVLVILIFSLLNINLPFSIDGCLGVLVALFILVSGIGLIREEINPLLGESHKKSDFNDVIKFVESFNLVLGTHDLIYHTYGPTVIYMTLHVEFDAREDIFKVHDQMDLIEEKVKEKYNISLTIHMDPIDMLDEETNKIKKEVEKLLKDIDNKLSCHDFRIVRRRNYNEVIFDVIIPYDCNFTKDKITNILNDYINKGKDKKYILRITFDNELFND